MAGGGGRPQNIFKLNRGDDPKEVLNWRLWFAVRINAVFLHMTLLILGQVLSFGIMGAARGEWLDLLSKVLPNT
jgi:hypothetical protein